MPANIIAKAEIAIAAPLEKAWEALTKPELVKQYLFGTDMETDWEVGGPITYSGEWEGKKYQDKGIVKEFVPETRIVTTYWSSASGLPDSPENYKTVEYNLMPAGDATHVTITQDNNKTEEEAKHSEKNWNMVLEGMKKLLEKKA
jgi:uncharacterized protein YndB with AHSA1/START domain